MPSRIRFVSLSVACGLAVVGFSLAPKLRGAEAEPRSGQEAGNPTERELKSVETCTPARKTMSRTLDVPATIRAYERVDVHAKASGYASEVLVDIGDPVKSQDVLAVLSVPEMEKELAEARAELQGKRALLEVASSAEVVAAQATVEQARRKLGVDRQVSEVRRVDLGFLERQIERKQELHGQGAVTDEALDEAGRARDKARVELAVAEAQALESESEVARAEADLAVAKSRIDVVASEVALAEARVERLETLAEYARIRAPFDGVVTRRMIDPGALVQDSTKSGCMPLFTVQRVDRMRVGFDVPEVDLPFVTTGTRATIRPFAAVGVSFEGAVSRIAASLETGTRTMRAEIDLENPEGRLVDGMYVQVVLSVDLRPDALTIPAAALLHEAGKAFVYVVSAGTAEKRELAVGLDDGIDVEVRSGLAADEQVVVVGMALISPGERVRAVPGQSAGALGSAK
jgi:RND family efflux transporter MFP subunit